MGILELLQWTHVFTGAALGCGVLSSEQKNNRLVTAAGSMAAQGGQQGTEVARRRWATAQMWDMGQATGGQNPRGRVKGQASQTGLSFPVC